MNWNNKKVLITGNKGFKGSWLTMMLLEKGANVVGYSLPAESEHTLFDALKLDEKITAIHGDVRDLKSLEKTINEHNPEVIFHLAAQPQVKRSYLDPIETFESNVIGTANVLEAAKRNGNVRAIVCITSDKCYENVEWLWPYRETDRLGGHDPYSASKACAEIVISSYRRSFFNDNNTLKVASTRAGNVIGGGDWSKDRIVPDVVRAIYSNSELEIRSPQATRPWQHVIEPLSGYILVAEALLEKGSEYADAWNFGPNTNEVVPVSGIIDYVNETSDKQVIVRVNPDPNFHEANLLALDISKARKLLKWKQKLSVKEAVAMTMAWYNAYYNGEDIVEFTKKQIKEYEER